MEYNKKVENAMKKDFKYKLTSIIMVILFCQTINVFAIDSGKWSDRKWKRVMDLRGHWKFEIGDDMDWAKPDYNDKDWESIFVPSKWEDEGFPGYDGFAWYRTTFIAEDLMDRDNLYLRLGNIDDCDEVYLNGHFIGHHGLFPPNFNTEYSKDRDYYIHKEYLKPNRKNTIAIRVYDIQGPGGIVSGNIGFFTKNTFLSPQINLSGKWKFKKGDRIEWKEEDYNDDNWSEVFVPAFWSQYGLKEYDGFGWYRKEFKIPAQYRDERLILLLGKIDDLDEVYLNGNKIGHTGPIDSDRNRSDTGDNWIKDRAYTLPSRDLKENGINVIAVRVYDGQYEAGIYDGPIGIVTRDQYLKWQRNYGSKDDFKDIINFFFGE